MRWLVVLFVFCFCLWRSEKKTSREKQQPIFLTYMPTMPSADMRAMTTNPSNRAPEFNISSKDVEGLVLEIKENLRLSAKAIPCSHLSRKSSRASPYRVPGRICCESSTCESATTCLKRSRRKPQPETQEDPYELLQKLLRDGSLVNEAVRRVQLGLTPKQRYFYESDEESSPMIRLCSEN